MSENPLRDGLPQVRVPAPCVLVIFGATGDLTHRKLIPALYRLGERGLLPPNFAVVGFARRPKTNEEFRAEMKKAVVSVIGAVEPQLWERFEQSLFYHISEFSDAEGYQKLKVLLSKLDQEQGTAGNRLYYLATAPDQFEVVTEQLRHAELNKGTGWARLVVEKPFGVDLASAKELNHKLRKVFAEADLYRIDHYLGKETVQNILVFRFANATFEPLWNKDHIDHVQITVSEILGVESRGKFYEQVGALRDMVQNHMMQLLSLVAMEPPVSLNPEAIRDEKVRALRSVRILTDEEVKNSVIHAQYSAGSLGGEKVKGYLEEENVSPQSSTETFLATRLWIDNWRWSGVPFYLRHGKRLPKYGSEIAIQFKHVPQVLFNVNSAVPPNALVIRIQPDEGIAFKINTKVPGPEMRINPVKMDFRYGQVYGHENPEAYERLLLDAMAGDPTLFIRGDETEVSWRLFDRVLHDWHSKKKKEKIPQYAAGTWGPYEAESLIKRDGREWRRI